MAAPPQGSRGHPRQYPRLKKRFETPRRRDAEEKRYSLEAFLPSAMKPHRVGVVNGSGDAALVSRVCIACVAMSNMANRSGLSLSKATLA
jgi:hypothetical protein